MGREVRRPLPGRNTPGAWHGFGWCSTYPQTTLRHSTVTAVSSSTPEAPPASAPDRPVPVASSRRTWLVAALLVGLHAALIWETRWPTMPIGDDAIYLSLGRSLQHGSYREEYLVDAPSHRKYPPGYPAALAVADVVGGRRFVAGVVLNILLSGAALAVSFALFRRLLPAVVSIASLAALAVNPYLIERAGRMLTEPLYTALTVLALWGTAAAGAPSRRRTLWVCAAAIAAAMTRNLGVAAVAAVALWLLQRRKPRALAAFVAAAGIVSAAWLVYLSRTRDAGGSSYVADAAVLPRRIAQTGGDNRVAGYVGMVRANAEVYLLGTLPTQLPAGVVPGTQLDNHLGVALVLGAIVVGLAVVARRLGAVFWYLLAYLALLVAWPVRVDRFITPLLPLLLPVGALGIHALGQRLGLRRAATAAALGFGGMVAVASLLKTGAVVSRWQPCRGTGSVRGCAPDDDAATMEAAAWLRTAAAPDEAILTAHEPAVGYHSDRRVLPWPRAMAHPDSTLLPLLRAAGVRYVLLSSVKLRDAALDPRLRADCAELALAREFAPRTYVLRLRAPGEPRDASACAAVDAHRRANLGRNFYP